MIAYILLGFIFWFIYIFIYNDDYLYEHNDYYKDYANNDNYDNNDNNDNNYINPITYFEYDRIKYIEFARNSDEIGYSNHIINELNKFINNDDIRYKNFDDVDTNVDEYLKNLFFKYVSYEYFNEIVVYIILKIYGIITDNYDNKLIVNGVEVKYEDFSEYIKKFRF